VLFAGTFYLLRRLGTISQFKLANNFIIFFSKNEIIMNKTKFSLDKAQKAVEISSKIEGHKIPLKKINNSKSAKSKLKS
jgi:hypothetical protein